MTKYQTHKTDENGWTEWIQPRMDGYKMQCCDCGLVHELQFRVTDPEDPPQKVQFRARRNNRATSQVRRHRKK